MFFYSFINFLTCEFNILYTYIFFFYWNISTFHFLFWFHNTFSVYILFLFNNFIFYYLYSHYYTPNSYIASNLICLMSLTHRCFSFLYYCKGFEKNINPSYFKRGHKNKFPTISKTESLTWEFGIIYMVFWLGNYL